MKPMTLFDRVKALEADVARLTEMAYRHSGSISELQLSAPDTPIPDPSEAIAPRRAAMRRIAREYATANGITLEDLCGPRRDRHIAWPRQDLMTALCAAGYSRTEIGRFLNRDQSTVTDGIRAAKRRIEKARKD